MSGSKSLALYFIFFLCFSCAEKGNVVCSGDKKRCEKYNEALTSIGLNPRVVETGSVTSLWVSSLERDDALSAINLLSPHYAQADLLNETGLTEKFVPLLKNNLTNSKEALRKLSSMPGVFSVQCDKVFGDYEAEAMVCKISFLSKIISQDQLEAKVKLYAIEDKLSVLYLDLSKILSEFKYASNNQPKISSEMIRLTPFSFHVPYAEKSIAGIQLILVLIIFLFSGFILGLWLRTKESRDGRKSL